MRTDGCCPKCNSSSSFNTYKSMDDRIYCECHNPDCKYTGDSVEFMFYQPKMKSSELSFKLITNSEYRNKTIIELMRKIGFPILYINQHCCAFYVNNNNCGFLDEINSVFENMSLKEVTFDEAVKLIESCEPLVKKSSGKFIEYDIDENGYYNLENGGKFHWQEYVSFEIAKGCIFGGWLWVNKEKPKNIKWKMERHGMYGVNMITACNKWEYPLIPSKIRFWVKD